MKKAGALFPEKKFNFLKGSRLVGCYLSCTDSTKPVLRIWQCKTMVFGLLSHFFLSLPLSGICAVFMLFDNHELQTSNSPSTQTNYIK